MQINDAINPLLATSSQLDDISCIGSSNSVKLEQVFMDCF